MAQIGPDRVALSAYTGAALRVSSRRRRTIGFSEDSPGSSFSLCVCVCDRDSGGGGKDMRAQSQSQLYFFGRSAWPSERGPTDASPLRRYIAPRPNGSRLPTCDAGPPS
jgi:hypothetical protein